MSTCKQATAARRKSRINPRYKRLKSGDAAVNKRRLEARMSREKERQIRKGTRYKNK